MSQQLEFVSIQTSPWSLKARFALKYHGIKYKTTPHAPVVGDLKLRWRLWRWSGKVTVPILFYQGGALTDSMDIAQWADDHSAQPGAVKLFPEGQLDAIKQWNRRSDIVLFYTRKAMIEKGLTDKSFALNFLPRFLRQLGPFSHWLASWGIGTFGNKYKAECESTSLDKARAALTETREALKASGGQYLLGTFTYADIVMAAPVQVISPIGPPFSKSLGRRLIEFPELRDEFQDLVAWRDELFKRHWPVEEARS